MFNPKVRSIEFELTNRCNAACPMCSRVGMYPGGLSETVHNSKWKDVSVDVHHHVLDSLDHSVVDAIEYGGCFGDPLMHPNILQLLKYGSGLYQEVQTNASLQSLKFWKETAKIDGLRMWFHLDGLSDTNHIYRRFTDWNKIERNAKTFLDAGGKGSWVFIVFRHNEHQVEEAREMAAKWGMDEFIVKKTSRGFEKDNDTQYLKALDKKGNVENLTYQTPLNPEYRVDHINNKIEEKPIDCYSMLRGKYYITCENELHTCCLTGKFAYLSKWVEKSKYDMTKEIPGEILFSPIIDPQNNSFNTIVDNYNQIKLKIFERWKNRDYKICANRCGTNVMSQKVHEVFEGGEGTKRSQGWEGQHGIRNK